MIWTILYHIAAALAGYVFPELLKIRSNLAVNIPLALNLICAFIGVVFCHFLLSLLQ